MIVHYRNNLRKLSRKLRKKGIYSEVLLWQVLKGKKIYGYQFTRQKPIGDHIVDFYCPRLNLAIEIDGATHNFQMDEDKKRQAGIERMGVHILRFLDVDVRNNLQGVVEEIKKWIGKQDCSDNPLSPPFLRGKIAATTHWPPFLRGKWENGPK